DGISDSVSALLTIAVNPDDLRLPGHTVVDGVDLGSGNLGLTYSDVEIKNRGLSLLLERSYNTSGANAIGPFGYGWHYNYQILLVHNSQTHTYMMWGGDGKGKVFQKSKLNTTKTTMPADLPFHTSLVKNGDGTFDYFTKSHIQYRFPGALEKGAFTYYNQSYM